MRRKTSAAAAVAAGIAAAGLWTVRRFGRRSGITEDEAQVPLAGDDVVPDPDWESTRAITIAAPPALVWPWLVQMGYPTYRAGWYTPHWLDELMWGERPRSADEIVTGLQDLQVGDRVPDSADWSVYYIVEELVPESHILLHSRTHVFWPVEKSDFTWVFALVPLGTDRTRLFVRARVSYRPRWALPILETALGLGDFVNVSVMLRGIKRRAEREYLGLP